MNTKFTIVLPLLVSPLVAVKASEQPPNVLGHQQSQFALKSGFYTVQNGAKDSDYKQLDPNFNGVDDSVITSVDVKSQFTWGASHLIAHHGLKNATNKDGQQIVANVMLNTGLKPIKLFAGYDELSYKHGATETKYRYGVGFGLPIKGQLITGYLTKIYGTLETPGLENFEGDNGYSFALKTRFKLTDNISWDSALEYTWNRKLTTLPLLENHPLRMIAEDNLSKESWRLSNKLSYEVTRNIDLGVEYIYLKGDAVFVENAGLLGAFASVKF